MRAMLKSELKNQLIGIMLVLSAALLWGSSFAVRKMGMNDMGPLMQNAARFFTAFCFMLAVLLIRHIFSRERRQKKTQFGRQIKYGIIIGAVYGLAALFQQLGLSAASAGATGFVTSIYTVLVPVMSWLFFRDRIKKQVWYGMILSFTGLFMVTNCGFHVETGIIILFAGSIMYALQIILIGKFIKTADPLILVTVQVAMGAIVNLTGAIAMKENFSLNMISNGYGIILYTGIFSLGIANLCQLCGQKKIQPSVTAIVCSLESVFGMIFGVVLLDESISFVQGIGCVLIFTAIIVSQIKG